MNYNSSINAVDLDFRELYFAASFMQESASKMQGESAAFLRKVPNSKSCIRRPVDISADCSGRSGIYIKYGPYSALKVMKLREKKIWNLFDIIFDKNYIILEICRH